MSGDWWVIIVAALPVLGLLGFAVVRGRGGDDEHDSLGAAEEDRPVPAIVANPTKADPDTRRLVSTVCTSLGWAEPLWLETTVLKERPPYFQHRRSHWSEKRSASRLTVR